MPDAAVALVAACRDAGLPLHQAAGAAGSSAGPAGAAAGGAGELENLFVGSGQATRPLQRFNSCEGLLVFVQQLWQLPASYHPNLAAAHGAISGFASTRHAPSGRQPVTDPRVYNCAAGERLAEREEAAGGDHAGAAQLQRTSTLTDYERSETAREFQLYVCEVLQQL